MTREKGIQYKKAYVELNELLKYLSNKKVFLKSILLKLNTLLVSSLFSILLVEV